MWLDILSFPGTPAADRAYRDIERWVFSNYRPPYAAARPEWSKGWAYTEHGAWRDHKIIQRTLPMPSVPKRTGTPPSAPLIASIRTPCSRALCCAPCYAPAAADPPKGVRLADAAATEQLAFGGMARMRGLEQKGSK